MTLSEINAGITELGKIYKASNYSDPKLAEMLTDMIIMRNRLQSNMTNNN